MASRAEHYLASNITKFADDFDSVNRGYVSNETSNQKAIEEQIENIISNASTMYGASILTSESHGECSRSHLLLARADLQLHYIMAS